MKKSVRPSRELKVTDFVVIKVHCLFYRRSTMPHCLKPEPKLERRTGTRGPCRRCTVDNIAATRVRHPYPMTVRLIYVLDIFCNRHLLVGTLNSRAFICLQSDTDTEEFGLIINIMR